MVSELLWKNPVRESSEFDMLKAIYESDCDAVLMAQHVVIAEHMYRASGYDQEILMEGFMDMLHSIGEWFKKIINAIKDFFVKAFKSITDSMTSLEEFVRRNKEYLLKSTIDKTMKGFKFTVLDSPAPNMSAFDRLIGSYNDIVSDLSEQKAGQIKSDSVQFLKRDNLAKLRGEVLGSGSGYEQDSFVEEVRKFYRDGYDQAHDIGVDSDYIHAIVDHVTTLTEAKKKAVEDRDRIIKLLNRAEKFFSSNVVMSYANGSSKIKTKTISSTSSSKTFSTDAGKDVYYEDNYKTYSTLINTKYNETKALANIITVVVTERMNALVDQVKQERSAVTMAMKPEFTVSESVEYGNEFDQEEDETDYFAIESLFNYSQGPVLEEITLRNMCREAIWYANAMEGTIDDSIVMEGFFGNLVETVKNLISRIVGVFKKKAKDTNKKYKDWLADDGVIDSIKENAKLKTLKLLNFWDGDYQEHHTQISNAINSIAKEPADASKCPFSATFVKDSDIETIEQYEQQGKNLDNILKNYFRCGKAGLDKMEPYTLAGSELAGKIDEMIEYVRKYDSFTANNVDLDARVSNLKIPVAEATSIGWDTFLSIENRPVFETDLSILLQHMMTTMEADDGGNKPDAGNAPAKETKKLENSAKDAKKTENVKVEDVTGEDPKDAAGGDGNGTAKEKTKHYYTFCCTFVRKATAAYLTVCEERRARYVEVLTACAGEKHKPKFENGKYVAIALRGKDEEVKEVSSNEDSGKKKKKKFGIHLGRVKESTEIEDTLDKPTLGIDWMM